MNRQTKELDLALSNVRLKVGGTGLQFLSPITRKEILSICQEAGLIFKHDCQSCPKREEDDYGLVCVITCAEPFKEIE